MNNWNIAEIEVVNIRIGLYAHLFMLSLENYLEL